jgi:ribose/xylose/arabinose/galactoside ABC-type transport system permease subunit
MDTGAARRLRTGREVKQFLATYGFYIIFILVFVIYSVRAPSFFTVKNVMNMLHTTVPLMVIACGIGMVIICGEIDLSVGSVALLANSIATVLMVKAGIPIPLAFLAVVLAGVILGALNGFFVVVLRVSSLIVTLGMLISFRGVALQITNSQVIGLPEALRAFGNFRVGPFYIDILFGLIIILLLHMLHTKRPYGRFVTATGNDREIAGKLGIPVRSVKFSVFVISGMLAAVGGFFSMTQVGAINPLLGNGAEFSGIAAVIIGGISLFGGEGKLFPGVFFGVFLLTVIETGLNQMSVSPYVYPFFRGGIIFIAMYADSLKMRFRKG